MMNVLNRPRTLKQNQQRVAGLDRPNANLRATTVILTNSNVHIWPTCPPDRVHLLYHWRIANIVDIVNHNLKFHTERQ